MRPNVRHVSAVLNTEPDHVAIATLRLFHAFGLTVKTFMPLIEGIPAVTHTDPTDAAKVGDEMVNLTSVGDSLRGPGASPRL